MIHKRSFLLLSGILFVSEGMCLDSKEVGVEAFLQPANDKIKSRFVSTDRDTQEGVFTIEGEGITSLIPAPSYTVHNDDKKTSVTVYSSTFLFGGVNYLTTYNRVSSYKPEFEEKKNKIVYYRSDNSVLEEDPRPMFPIVLNEQECQKAYEEGTLQQYFSDKNITLIPAIDHGDMQEALFMVSLCAATSGEKNLEALSGLSKQISEALEKEKENMRDFPVTGTYNEFYSQFSGKSQSLLGIVYKDLWSAHILIEKPLSVKKFDDAVKVQEFYNLSGLSIEGESYVFFKEQKIPYKFKEFRKTIEPTDNPDVFYEVSTPIYTIGYIQDERVLPSEALRILNKRESAETSTQNGLFCLDHSGWHSRDKKLEHTLRQCDKTTSHFKGVKIMPDGFSSPYDEIKLTYTLKGPHLISQECGNWYSSCSLKGRIKEDSTINEEFHSKIREAKKD